MTLTIKLVAVLAFVSISASLPVDDKSTDQTQDDTPAFSPPEAPADASDSYQLYQPQQLPLALELPKQEQNPVAFYAPEPVTFLKAPRANQEPDFYQVPIPNQELAVPVDTEWNPDNDPTYYYEVPAIITKQELPTQEFPKKYNKDIHQKEKPFSSKPKQEVLFEPINEKQFEEKQVQLEKNYDKLAKKENQKIIKMLPPRNRNPPKAPTDNIEKSSDQLESATFDQGLSAQITDSLGIPTTHGESSKGERLEFHMVGHDGPLSYKWGYDTGKGHNRLFRYEERDKEGVVKGHYGFYDEEGKLRVTHYDAHPHTGFHVSENT